MAVLNKTLLYRVHTNGNWTGWMQQSDSVRIYNMCSNCFFVLLGKTLQSDVEILYFYWEHFSTLDLNVDQQPPSLPSPHPITVHLQETESQRTLLLNCSSFTFSKGREAAICLLCTPKTTKQGEWSLWQAAHRRCCCEEKWTSSLIWLEKKPRCQRKLLLFNLSLVVWGFKNYNV